MIQFFSGLVTVPTHTSRRRPSQGTTFQPAAAQVSPRGELCVGALARVGKHTFRVTQPLGQGSFSSVWVAVNVDGSGGELAIKETVCRTHAELADAETEGRIVQQVGSSSSRVPELIAIETIASGSGSSIVRLAMTKVPGESLGSFVNRFKKQHGRVPTSSPQVVANQFAEACNWAHELISQLLPAFEAISPSALHRDVNTHNVLVSTAGDLRAPQFGLIDFGLATEMQNWASLSTQVPVVGDCRYWPVSAWFIFAAGGAELLKQPQLLMEYRSQLDLHALGITALQLFVELLPQLSVGSAAVAIVPEEFQALKRAWDHYWQDAYRFWEPLFHAFERKTDWMQLRQSYFISSVHLIISESLGHLRQALSNARDLCARADPGSQLFTARPLFAVLLELISQGGKSLPGEAAPGGMKLSSWQTIRSILSAGSSSTSPSNWALSMAGGTSTTPIVGTTTQPTLFSHMPAPLHSFPTSAVATSSPPFSCYAPVTLLPRVAQPRSMYAS